MMGILVLLKKKSVGWMAALLFFGSFSSARVFAQGDFRVDGVVKDNQGPLPGVTVREVGANNATLTDKDGKYGIVVSGADASLLFTYVGYEAQTISIAGKHVLNVDLSLSSQSLSDVVVTALGISRDKKALGYDVSNVTGEQLDKVPQENVLTGLTGKVTGVTINQVGGTGSSVNMVIRGANSLSNDNQPLFVIDGVPINNGLNNVSGVGGDNNVDFGNAIASLNPDDIEDVSILKGPSAAALYGSRAGNGVVLITTKNGKNTGRLTVSVSTSNVFDVPYKYLKWQTKFSNGGFAVRPELFEGSFLLPTLMGFGFDESVDGAFGMEMDRGYSVVQWNSPTDADGNKVPLPLVAHPNNMKDFLQTGITSQNTVSVANSNDFINYRISYSDMRNRGNIPKEDLFRKTLDLNAGLKINRKVTLSTNLNFSRNNSNHRPGEGRGTNPLYALAITDFHIDINDLKNYWVPGQEGLQQLTPYQGVFDNPYFLANEVKNSFKRDRLFGNLKLDWQLHPKVDLMLRYGLDTYYEERRMEIPVSYSEEPRGAFGIVNLRPFESNADFLATYKDKWNDFSLSASIGGNTRYQTSHSVSVGTKTNAGLVVPGLYTLSNILPSALNYGSSVSRRKVNSLYAMTSLGFKETVFLDLSGRNDWSSTLPKADPFFYPSASLSVLLDELAGINSNTVNLIKIRGGVAQVGNDAGVYQLESVLGNSGAWGDIPRLTTSSTLLNPNLKPEKITSYEGGLDANFFDNRLRFTGTYYMIEDQNQIFNTTLPSSSGYTSKNINAGLVRSRGWELSLGLTPVKTNDWRWDIDFNFTRTRTKVVRLAPEMPFFTFWEAVKGGAWTFAGEDVGTIYGGKVETVDDPSSPYYGFPLLTNEDGAVKWNAIPAHTLDDKPEERNKVGNFNPNFIMGINTSLSYKNWSLNLTVDWRSGGDFVSQTYRYGMENGHTQIQAGQYINQGNATPEQLRDFLMDHADEFVKVKGRHFPRVGWPTPDYTSYPFSFEGLNIPYGGVFIPGVYKADPDNPPVDDQGNPQQYVENLGENILGVNGTLPLPYATTDPWDFIQAFTFPADFIKLREVSVSYRLPRNVIGLLKLQEASFSVFSRNIMIWTKAKLNIDPERAFQASGSGFNQGIELYNVNPWVMPVGFKLNVVF